MNNDAYIAYKQIELVGAVAPKATIYYYTSATTDYDTGMNFALIRAIADDDVQVLLNGFQSCETALGTTGMELVNEATEQAAAQGMTVIAAAGNTGSAACEVPGTAGTATSGYAINGYASSPYLTAVGGTDFFYGTGLPATHYWTTNSGYKSIQNAPIPGASVERQLSELQQQQLPGPQWSWPAAAVSATQVMAPLFLKRFPRINSTTQKPRPSAAPAASSLTSRSSREAAATSLRVTTAPPTSSACSQ